MPLRNTRIALTTLVLALCMGWGKAAHAGHFAGGDITYECLGGTSYEITLDLFLDCAGSPMIPQDLNFSNDCGLSFSLNALPVPVPVEVSQLCVGSLPSSSCSGGALPGMEHYVFSVVVNLPPCNDWTISWDLCCRAGTINLNGTPGMYIEATLDNSTAPCNNSPVFTDQSIPYVCVGQPVNYNYGVTEPDGNTIVYSLVPALYDVGLAVPYNGGYTGLLPAPGITLDVTTGQLFFIPALIGNYVVSVLVEEYDINGVLIGSVMRDQMFVVLPCTGNVPLTNGISGVTGAAGTYLVTGANSIEVCDGAYVCVDVVFTDPDAASVLQVVSQAAALLPGSTFTVVGTNPATATICWTADAAYSPVNVLITADDGNCPVENTASTSINWIVSLGGGGSPDPGTNGSVSVCGTGAPIALFPELGGTPDVGGSWTAPGNGAHSGMYDPLVDAPGIYTYTVGNACASANATVTVTETAGPDAGTSAALNICSNSPPANLFASLLGTPQAGGTWTAPGGIAHGAIYDPAVDAPGIYTYTVVGIAPCGNATATVTVVESAGPNAGTNGTLTVCANTPATPLFLQLGGAPSNTGSWTGPGGLPHGAGFNPNYIAAIHNPGVFTYTVPGVAPCADATATVTVTEVPLPVAGTNGALSICANAAPVNMFASLGGAPQAGGSWTAPGGIAHGANYDPTVDAPGIYTYTVSAPPCANATATVTVTETAAPNAGTSTTLTLCSNSAATNMFPLLGGATAGGVWTAPGGAVHAATYNPAVDAPGIYTYTVGAGGPCGSSSSTVTVTENVATNAGTNGTLTLCSTSAAASMLAALGGTPQAGGAWTAPGGVAHGANYDPAVDAPGIYTYTVTGVAPCTNATATVTITENAAANAGTNGTWTLCSSGGTVSLFVALGGSPQAGGTWTAPGGAAHGANYDPAVDAPGIYTYTVAGVAPCANATATVTVTENAAPVAGTNGALTLCANSIATDMFLSLGGAPQAGGSWTAPGGVPHGANYDPSLDAAGIYTYTVAGVAPCANATATVTVTENAAPVAGTNGALTLCANSIATDMFLSLGGAPQAGGSWTAPGGVPHGANYDPSLDAAGIYTYTVAGVAPCANATATVTVTENAAPVAGTNGALTLCANSIATDMFLSLGGAPQAGGAWTAPGGVAHGANYDPAVDAPGIYTYTVAGVAPCANATATITVTENAAPVAGTNGTLTLCANSIATDMFLSLGGAPQAGGAWTAPGGVAHGANYDPSMDAAGIYTYTVAGVAPCANATATVTVTENAAPVAGTNGTLTLCANSIATDMFLSLGGAPQAGGSWTAPGGVPHGANYDPAVDAPGIYTYTVAGVAPCANATATVTVTENAAPVAGTNGALTLCANSIATDMFLSLGGVPQAGGAWTAPGGVAHGANYDPAVDAPGIYTYTVAGVAPCANATATVTVTENAAPVAGTNGTLTLCANSIAADMFLSLGGAPQAGGSWTAPGGVPHGANYDPAVDAPGIYTYTVAGVAPCANATATVTVTENAAPVAGTNGALTLCANSIATDMFLSLGGVPQAGGSWTAPGGVAHGANYDPAVDAPGIYTYTVAGVAPCVNATATVTVTENAAPVVGTNGTLTLCANSIATDMFLSLGGAPQAGGSWTAPGGVPHSANYDPAVDAPGIYTYTVAGVAPCANATATVTVTENAAPVAGTNGALTLCANSIATDMFLALGGAPQAGGAWTAPGGVAHGANYDPAVDAPGIYTYTVAGVAPCANATATVTVTENAAPVAGTNGALTLCANSIATDMFLSLGGAPQAGGSWTAPGGVPHGANYDPAVDAPGIYTYTVAGVAPCANATATVTVTENAAANAGTNGTWTLCSSGGTVSLFVALGGSPQAGGSWTAPGGLAHGANYDPAVDAPGIYTYTVMGIAPCANATATVTVTENVPSNAGTNGSLTLCATSGAANMFLSLGGAPQAGGSWTAPGGVPHGANYDPAVDAAGIYTYTVAGVAPCANATATVTVTENAAANAGINSAIVLCDQAAPSDLFNALGGAPSAGGSWTAPGGGASTGIVDPAIDPPGVYSYTVVGTAPCPNASATVNVTITSTPDAGVNGSLALCDQGAAALLFTSLGGTPDAGGTWTAPGGTAHSGTIDPANDPAGVYTYTIAAVAPCTGAVSTVTVTINAAPDAGVDGNLSVCAQGVAVGLFAALGGSPDAGGSWTAPGGAAHGANYDPAVDPPGIYTYTVAGVAPCANATATVTVVEIAVANAGANGTLTTCSNSGASSLFAALGGAPQAGGTWTAPGGSAHGSTYDPSVDGPGVYTYTVVGVAPCPNAAATVTVTENAAPDAGIDAAVILCDQGAPQGLFAVLGGSPDAGGSWTAPGGAAHSGTIDPAVDPAGIYTYTVAGVAPCAGASATITVTITGSPDAGTNGALTLCATDAASALFAALGGSPDAGGSWTDPNGVAHGPNVDPSIDPSGVYTYTIAAIPPCLGATSTVTVTINPSPDPGIDGALTVCDQGAPQSLLAALGGTPQAGGSWTAPGGAAHGGTIDPTVDPAGIYTYSVAGVAPCGSASATVTVTITSSPNAGTNGAWTLCEDMAPTSLFAALGGSPDAGGSWTDPNGVAHGPNVDPAVDPSGVYTYTIAAIPPCLGATSTVTVTINPSPDPGIDGALTVCDQGAPQGLFASIGGTPQAGGSWTAPGGAAHSGTIDPTVDPAGIYTYTVAGVAPCGNASATVTVTITSSPSAGTNGAWTLCEDMAATSLFAALGGSPDAGGSWTDPNGVAHGPNVDPAVDPSGVYTYTIAAIPPCLGATSTVTVTINPSPDPGIDGALTVCDQGAPQGLFASIGGTPQAGGSWTAPGGAAHSGTIDPTVDPAGIYTYTVAGVAPCGNASATVTVTITSSPSAGTNGAWTLCEDMAATSLFAALGGSPDAGGSWTDPNGVAHGPNVDPAVDPSGVYTYTIAAIPPCLGATSTVTVTINPSPDPGIDGALTVCDQGAPQALFASLGGTPQAGGSWTAPGGAAHGGTIDPTVDPAGVYTYTVAGVAPCGSASATVTVTITSSPNAGTNGSLVLCDQGAIADLFSALGGSPDAGGTWADPNGVLHSGNIDPSSDPPGIYTYSVAATAPCIGASATITVTIDVAPDAGTDGVVALCTGDAPFVLFTQLGGSPDAGGTWTDPNGVAFGNVFDPGADTPGNYTYTVGSGACPPDQSVVAITVNPGPDAGLDNAIALCSNGAGLQLTGALLGTPDPNGTWTDPNGLPFAGTFDPALSLPGVYTYTVAGNAGCPDDVAELTMAVSPEADAGGNGSIDLCTTDPNVDLFTLLGGTPDVGGGWTDPNGNAFGVSLDPSTAISGNYTYTVTGLPPCADATASIAVTITPAPDAGLDTNATYCDTEPAVQLFGLLGGNAQSGGSWTDPNGDPTTGSFDPANDAPGAYTYRVIGTGACVDDESVVTVNVSIAADAGSDGSITVCSNDAPFALFALLGGSPDAGGTWTAPGGSASNGSVDPATGLNGNYTYTVQSPVPCAAQSAMVNVTIIPNVAPVITVDIGTGCAPVMASITSSYNGPGTCLWDLGNGTTSTECEPDSILYGAGVYDLTVTIDPGNGCIGTFTYPAAVEVVEQPTASFYALPDTQVSINNAEIIFVNTSTNDNAWLWQFDSLDESTDENPLYIFPQGEPGEYDVCLIAYASATCSDTACHTIVVQGSGYWVPNTFTPDGDGHNDFFFPVLGNPHPEEFRFMIFDRWGQPLFDTSDPTQYWNGNFTDGTQTPIGVYVWKLWLREPFTTDRVERTGHVTVLR